MAYPKVLPVPTRDGYGKRPSYSAPRFKMDDGNYRAKTIAGAVPYTYALTWNLTYPQTRFFEAWLEYDIIRAQEPMQIPLAETVINVEPKTGIPTYRPNGSKWLVSLEVEEIRAGGALPVRGAPLPSWPVNLPDFESSGFSLSAPDSVAVSDIEAGRRELRERFYQRTTTYGGSMIMDLSQRNEFWQFWNDTLLAGKRRFLAPFANAKSQAPLKAKFAQVPEETTNGAWFNIAIVLDTLEAPMLSYDEYREFFHFVNTYADFYVEDGYAGYWSL